MDRPIKKPDKKGSIKFRQKKSSGKQPGRKDNKGDHQWKRGGRTAFVWIMFFVLIVFLYQMMTSMQIEGKILVSYSEYRKFLENDQIQEAEITDRDFEGILTQTEKLMRNGSFVDVKKFKTILPEFYPEMLKEWDEHNVKYDFKEKGQWSPLLFSTLPLLLLIVVWLYLFRRMQGGGNKGIFSFGKSRAKLIIESDIKVTFQDVAGADEAKVELQEIIDFLKTPERFEKLGGRIPKGALLVGAPGTGKTLLARAIAGEAGVPFFSISGADFVEMFVGVGASRVRDLFEQGKKNAPCIIFIDEIDAVGRSRGAGLGGGHDEREQTLNALLVEMDGFEHNEGVILIAATNRPDVLDTALMRPGRFDRQIVVDRPDVRGREGILKVHTKKIPLDDDVDLSVVAKGTPGLAGADLANLVNEAALLAARAAKKKVDMDDFEMAKDKVMMGVERKSLLISEEEKRSTAYHESGHVLVSKFVPDSDPIHKVTIIPRGQALGVTHSLPIDERHTYSKSYCEAMIAKMMGGRAAEKLVYGSLSTGAGNDIEQATNLARKMVCEWGMSDVIGPLTFGKKEEEVFLGREIATQRNFSEKTAQLIDEEIRKIVEKQEKRAVKILKEKLNLLHELAKLLLKKEILNNQEIDDVINGKLKAKDYNPKNDNDGRAEKPAQSPKGIYVSKDQKTDKKKPSPQRRPGSLSGRTYRPRPTSKTVRTSGTSGEIRRKPRQSESSKESNQPENKSE